MLRVVSCKTPPSSSQTLLASWLPLDNDSGSQVSSASFLPSSHCVLEISGICIFRHRVRRVDRGRQRLRGFVLVVRPGVAVMSRSLVRALFEMRLSRSHKVAWCRTSSCPNYLTVGSNSCVRSRASRCGEEVVWVLPRALLTVRGLE
jgi:hypothetical protein